MMVGWAEGVAPRQFHFDGDHWYPSHRNHLKVQSRAASGSFGRSPWSAKTVVDFVLREHVESKSSSSTNLRLIIFLTKIVL